MTMLQPYIAELLNATIWRMEIDQLTETLVIEVRDQETKQVSFTSINLLTGKLNFTNYATSERWLTGIEAVYSNVLLLHHYKHESGPEHKAIIAVNATTGANLWSDYSIAFDHLSINGPVVYPTAFQNKRLMLADVMSGKMIRPYNATLDKPLPNDIVIPSGVSPEQFLPGFLPFEAYGNIVQYLNYNNYGIVSLHAQKNGVLAQHLYIILDAEIVYHDILNDDIQKLQPEAFVLHKNTLIYIKNRVLINALKLQSVD